MDTLGERLLGSGALTPPAWKSHWNADGRLQHLREGGHPAWGQAGGYGGSVQRREPAGAAVIAGGWDGWYGFELGTHGTAVPAPAAGSEKLFLLRGRFGPSPAAGGREGGAAAQPWRAEALVVVMAVVVAVVTAVVTAVAPRCPGSPQGGREAERCSPPGRSVLEGGRYGEGEERGGREREG